MPSGDKWAERVALAQAGDRSVEAEIVAGNLGLVRARSFQWSRFGVSREDLESEGAIALLLTIREHDFRRTFVAAAGYRIGHSMFDLVRRHKLGGVAGRGSVAGRIIIHASKIWEDAQGSEDALRSLVEGIEHKTGLRPSKADALAAVQAAIGGMIRIDALGYDWIPSNSDPEVEFEREEFAHMIRSVVDRLPDAERSVVVRNVMGEELLVDVGGGGTTPRERHASKIRAGRSKRRALARLRAILVSHAPL